jgi:hypothetical protein
MADRPTEKKPQRTVLIEDPALRTFEGGFTSIPNRILENADLSLGARMAYAMLLKYAWQDDFCYPAQESIARDLGVTDRSVRTFLKELRDGHYISWKQQGLNRPNIYFLKRLPVRRKATDGHSGPEKSSGPDRNAPSGQERKQASDYKYTRTKTQDVDVVKPHREGDVQLIRASFPVSARELTRAPSSRIDPQRVAYLADTLAEELGDHKAVSRFTFRRLIEALGEDLVWQVLGNVKEAAKDGIISGPKGAYFMGVAKQVARERGINLGLREATLPPAA